MIAVSRRRNIRGRLGRARARPAHGGIIAGAAAKRMRRRMLCRRRWWRSSAAFVAVWPILVGRRVGVMRVLLQTAASIGRLLSIVIVALRRRRRRAILCVLMRICVGCVHIRVLVWICLRIGQGMSMVRRWRSHIILAMRRLRIWSVRCWHLHLRRRIRHLRRVRIAIFWFGIPITVSWNVAVGSR